MFLLSQLLFAGIVIAMAVAFLSSWVLGYHLHRHWAADSPYLTFLYLPIVTNRQGYNQLMRDIRGGSAIPEARIWLLLQLRAGCAAMVLLIAVFLGMFFSG